MAILQPVSNSKGHHHQLSERTTKVVIKSILKFFQYQPSPASKCSGDFWMRLIFPKTHYHLFCLLFAPTPANIFKSDFNFTIIRTPNSKLDNVGHIIPSCCGGMINLVPLLCGMVGMRKPIFGTIINFIPWFWDFILSVPCALSVIMVMAEFSFQLSE